MTILIDPDETDVPPRHGVIASVEGLRTIVTRRQYEEFVYPDGHVLVDMQTANALVLVYDALSEASHEKFERMLDTASGLNRLVAFAWKQVSIG